MKKTKKLIALVIAMVMVLAMGATAFAADDADPTGSIEVTNPTTDPNADTTTYEAYRIFDMTTDGKTDEDGKYTAVAYTINEYWAGFFADGKPGAKYIVDTDPTPGKNLNPITIEGKTKYINITDANVADFAKEAFDYAQKNNIAATDTQTVNKVATSVKFENLALGYYMVYPKGASVRSGDYTSIVSITNTDPNGQIAQKAKWPGVEKEADDISTEVGQKVTYTLKSNVPDTTGYNKKYEMTFADKTSDGLTFDGVDTITVKIGTATLVKGTDYTVSTDTADFSVTIDMLKGEEGQKIAKYTYNDTITITYTATVNEDAVTKVDENHATLTYNNDPKDENSKDTTPPVEVKTYSAKVLIEKVDGADSSKKLEGAKFVLRVGKLGTADGDKHEEDIEVGKYYKVDDSGVSWVDKDSATVVITDKNGEASFDGLEDGTYELIEVEAPSGYNLVTEPIEVTIAGNPADTTTLQVTATVENNSGTQLPSTGGIGTTIFYVIGAILVIGAGVLLVTRRRMNAN